MRRASLSKACPGIPLTTRKSAKAKGRKVEKMVVEKLQEAFGFTDEDVRQVPASISGEDIHFSQKARDKIGASFEVKSRAKIAVYDWFDQCERNAGGHTPVLVIKADRKKPLAIVDFDVLLEIMNGTAD